MRRKTRAGGRESVGRGTTEGDRGCRRGPAGERAGKREGSGRRRKEEGRRIGSGDGGRSGEPRRDEARGYASTVRPVDDCQYRACTRIRLARTIQIREKPANLRKHKLHSMERLVHSFRGEAQQGVLHTKVSRGALFGKTDRTERKRARRVESTQKDCNDQ